MILSRDQNYKVGDLVNNTKGVIHKNEPAIVLKVHENKGFYSRCLIEYQDPNSITVDGRKVQNWVSAKDLRYDIQYLRDRKLEELLK
jgi:hypothetical protein